MIYDSPARQHAQHKSMQILDSLLTPDSRESNLPKSKKVVAFRLPGTRKM